MKTRLIFAAMLLMAFGTAKAQETLIPTPDGDGSKINTLVISGTGSVWLQQGNKLTFNDYGNRSVRYHVEDSVLYVEGNGTRGVTFPNLTYLKVSGTVGVRSKDKLHGQNLSISKDGTGELSLSVTYNNVYICSRGTSDVILTGDCYVFCGEAKSIGRLNTNGLKYMVKIEKSGDQWNMAFNIDDDLKDFDYEYLRGLVKNAQPFFEAESNRDWNLKKDGPQTSANASDTPELSELMRELNVNLQQLTDSVDWEKFESDMEQWGANMEEWGRKMEEWGEQVERKYGNGSEYHYEYHYENSSPKSEPKDEKPKNERPLKKNLLLDASWAGFDAGLNMLINQTPTNMHNQEAVPNLGIRPMRSWQFALNVIDVGIAFDKRHIAGLFTGVGISWNNFSWNNNIAVVYNTQNTLNVIEPTDPNRVVKNTKYGALYVQVPLMLEIRPTRRMYIDAGVTGGLRFAQWNRVKYADGTRVKYYHNSNLNLLKLDVSLRVGGKNMGFFANYALLPMFTFADENVHPISFGMSLIF